MQCVAVNRVRRWGRRAAGRIKERASEGCSTSQSNFQDRRGGAEFRGDPEGQQRDGEVI